MALGDEDQELGKLFREARTIAVVGIKAGEQEDAYQVPLYMQAQGYRIIPINPKLDEIIGERVYPSLRELPSSALPVDIINLFRASDHIPGHTDEILALEPPPRAVWMQLGIANGPSASRLRAAGIQVIQDRCIMVDHRRLEAANI